ncbi:UDP-N-acetylmuramoyl-L-alanine--D-glutamate ligase [Pseudaquidulcibacter saccharophilus]|uniref:UDP-N-acetylmuramoyl-L-alanine--D-glutamate ligase n=1 Tax=Pseudaquidulcibacter saccharophilus TaxID=2831900 RepID=UPI001EFF4E24|nr:UDP-N-acetylmuramoyl-L-alanine--D-glutamate ligase [Pseudaquidulcibacter saccharophilus]
MFSVTTYKNKEVAVFGLGRSGLTAAEALHAGGAKVYLWDDNEKARDKSINLGFDIKKFDELDANNISALVMSPGVPIYGPKINWAAAWAHENDIPIIGDIELFAREINSTPENIRPKTIGITGTNGKSTTTALIAHILQNAGRDVRMGGNIGTGVLSLAPPKAGAIYVIELSSYQLDLTKSLHLDVAIQINVSEDHIERHGTMERYVAAKRNIFANQNSEDYAIIGVDDDFGEELATLLMAKGSRRVIPISSGQFVTCGISSINQFLWDNSSGRANKIADLHNALALPGNHNGQNAAAAFAACRAIGLSDETIVEGIMNFGGLKHRLQKIGTIGKIQFYNDSKATNADASAQALNSFPRLRWIAGGQAKSDGIDPLSRFFPKIAKSYLFGAAAERFSNNLKNFPHEVFETLAQATQKAYQDAIETGDEELIVLSPACASFDQYSDFEARGDDFINVVNDIIAKNQK